MKRRTFFKRIFSAVVAVQMAKQLTAQGFEREEREAIQPPRISADLLRKDILCVTDRHGNSTWSVWYEGAVEHQKAMQDLEGASFYRMEIADTEYIGKWERVG